MSLICCEDVCVSYGSFEACKNISFSVEQGNYLCIVGANGSGKTTIVKAILGLLDIKAGKLICDKKNTGYLPQKSNIQRDFPASVKEVILSGFSNKLFYGKKEKEEVLKQIKSLGLESIENKSFSELSGGQQQRVLLARSLCAAKKLLVLDEPVTGLDPVVTDEFYSIIRSLNKDSGLAIIMVSHDVHRAVQNATHILHMNNSCLFFGTAEEYKKTKLYEEMSHVEVCETHLCNHCGTDCNASHVIVDKEE